MNIVEHRDACSYSQWKAQSDYIETDLQMERQLQSLSGGLAEWVSDEGLGGSGEDDSHQTNAQISARARKDHRKARLIHQSALDYLIDQGLRDLSSDLSSSVSESEKAHSRLSRLCILYVLATPKLQRDIAPANLGVAFPLLGYALEFWIQHATAVEQCQGPHSDILGYFRDPLKDFAIFSELYKMTEIVILGIVVGGSSLLHVAAANRLTSLLTPILTGFRAVDLMHAKDNQGLTAFAMAAAFAQPESAKMLVKYQGQAVVHVEDVNGMTPLYHLATLKEGRYPGADKRRLDFASWLLRLGADVNHEDKASTSALDLASALSNYSMVQFLVRNRCEVSSRDTYGRTPLYRSVLEGHDQITQFLRHSGAELTDLKDTIGLTPLHESVERQIVQRMLASDLLPFLYCRDVGGRMPLHVHARRSTKVCDLFLSRRDIDVNAKDDLGRTPLHEAANPVSRESDCPLSIQILLVRKDVDVNARNKEMQTPLHLAAGKSGIAGDRPMQLLLARRDVDVNAIDDEGNTALHIAAERNPDKVKLLLSRKDI